MDKELGVLYKNGEGSVYFSPFVNEGDLWFPQFPHTEIDFPMENLSIEVGMQELVLVEVLRKDNLQGEETTYLKTLGAIQFDEGTEIAIARSIVADTYREMFDEIYQTTLELQKEENPSIFISPESNRRLH